MLGHDRFGSWSCKNANARLARRNILGKLRVTRIDDSADMRLDAVLENYIFYIFPMYEFLHSLGHKRKYSARANGVHFTPTSEHSAAPSDRCSAAGLWVHAALISVEQESNADTG